RFVGILEKMMLSQQSEARLQILRREEIGDLRLDLRHGVPPIQQGEHGLPKFPERVPLQLDLAARRYEVQDFLACAVGWLKPDVVMARAPGFPAHGYHPRLLAS